VPQGVQPLPPAPVKPVRANRVILAICAVMIVLLALGATAAVLGLRSVGWSPGASTIHVIGNAMLPTVANDDYVVVHPYGGSSPRVGDIVVMRDPFDHSRNFIKRVVAGPRQTVLIRNATVLVDGRPLREPYVDPEPWTAQANWPGAGGRPSGWAPTSTSCSATTATTRRTREPSDRSAAPTSGPGRSTSSSRGHAIGRSEVDQPEADRPEPALG
jgi:signal peptidase I